MFSSVKKDIKRAHDSVERKKSFGRAAFPPKNISVELVHPD